MAAGIVVALLIAIASVRLGRILRDARTARVLAPLAGDLMDVATGEDVDGDAAARLAAVPRRHRPTLERAIVARLEFLRGSTARALTDVLEDWGFRGRWARRSRSLSPRRRAAALNNIALLRDSTLCGTALPLLSDRNPQVRIGAAHAIGGMRAGDGAVAVLEAVAPVKRGHLPMWVAMEAVGFPEAEAAVNESLTHPCVQVRTAAAQAVALSGWPSTAEQVRRMLLKEDNPAAMTHLVRALAVVGSDQDTTLLRGLAADGDADVRVAAIGALTEIGGEYPLLGELLSDDDPAVARAAAAALGRSGPRGWAMLTSTPQLSTTVAQEIALFEIHGAHRPQLPGGSA